MVYLWDTTSTYVPSINPRITGFRKDKNASFEAFVAHGEKNAVATVALLAPAAAVRMARGEAPEHTPPRHVVVSASNAGAVRVFEAAPAAPGGEG